MEHKYPGEILPPDDDKAGPTHMHPGTPFTRYIPAIEELFPTSEITYEHALAKRNLGVSGTLTYSDIFGSKTTVTFTSRVIPPEGDVGNWNHGIAFDVETHVAQNQPSGKA